VDDDVIGSEPEQAPRGRRRPGSGLTLPAVVRRHRRLAVTLAVLVAVVGVIAISRAGVHDLAPTPPTQAAAAPRPPLAGEILALASGQNAIYAVVDDCSRDCRPSLVSSADDGHTWTALSLPGAAAAASAVRSWRLAVTGVEDLLAIQDATGTTVTVGNASSPFLTRKIADGEALERVPAGREAMLGICGAPRCVTPMLEYLDPRTARRGPLAHQPPFPPRALGVGGGAQLWVAGIDPRTQRYAAAVSVDDGATWSVIALPEAGTGLRAEIVPIPELEQAYVLQGRPDSAGAQTADEVWLVRVPGPSGGTAPRRVRPAEPLGGVEGVAGIKDGRLLVTGDETVVVSPDGGEDRPPAADVDSTRYVLRDPMRGPHQLLLAAAVRTDGAASVALSDTGDADDWDVRPIVLDR
jgi:hypothetical protein